MATGIPVIISESDVFTVLKRYDIVFADHVEFILRSLGYRCLRSISSISDITAIEGYVKDIIYSKDRFERMSPEEKLKSFGEFFRDSPQKFIFLPGEKAVILAAVQIANKLLKSYETQYNYDKECSGKKRKGMISL
jgi:hypothetical protein